MSGWTGRRAAPLAGLCAAALVLCGQAAATESAATPRALTDSAPVAVQPAAVPEARAESGPGPAADPVKPAKKKQARKKLRKLAKSSKTAVDDAPKLPPGPLLVVVSLDKQTATLFAGGIAVVTSPISSGTRTHPTPMGVFSVIQKNRHHVSNIYGAKMPYMQRLTWSGTALHEGPLPGYPASHGCVRMTKDFSELLWKVTRIGARVIIARAETAPVEIEHPSLFVPLVAPPEAESPSASLSPAAREAEARVVRTADASNRMPRAVVEDSARPMVAAPLSNAPAPEQTTKLPIDGDRQASTPAAAAGSAPAVPAAIEQPPAAAASPQSDNPASPAVSAASSIAPAEPPAEPAPAIDPKALAAAEAAARAREARRRAAPISVFISRLEGKLYVRQGMEPLFSAPVTISDTERPIGTHVYTAMNVKDDGLRWTVVSIPSSYPRSEETAKPQDRKKRNTRRPLKAEPADFGPPSNASEALGRIAMPPDAVTRIAQFVKPGSSLIVSDNRLSHETGKSTDFIVETP